MEHIANRPDEALQDAIETALKVAIGNAAPHIGVSADHGTVTLTGEVSTHAERNVAHAATLAEWGVHSVADDITVHEPWVPGATDTDIARAAQAALLKADGVPTDSVFAEVSEHVLTLSGHVASASERLAAERAVTYLQNVRSIDNRLTVNDRSRTPTAL
jgi:osmotically-inducible protein OsmY